MLLLQFNSIETGFSAFGLLPRFCYVSFGQANTLDQQKSAQRK